MRDLEPIATDDDDVGPPMVLGADYVYRCGCYWFCGNAIACEKHRPKVPDPPSVGEPPETEG